mmetsp:Transcript_18060/g.43066  ORF Transcript_18060/g.43066 Transcript_18060/m.43066 type:complete len:437 (-) Transcript_18060:245-1555(-)
MGSMHKAQRSDGQQAAQGVQQSHGIPFSQMARPLLNAPAPVLVASRHGGRGGRRRRSGWRQHFDLLVVVEAATPLQVGIAVEGVLVQRDAIEHFAGPQEVGPGVDRTQHGDCHLLVAIVEHHGRRRLPVEGQTNGVPHRGRTEHRPDDVGAGAHAPFAQRLAKVLAVLFQARLAGHVEQTRQAEGRIHRHPHALVQPRLEAPLQQQVHRRPCIGDIAEEVADAGADGRGQHLGIGRRRGLEQVLVQRFVEGKDLAVPGFPRVQLLALGAHHPVDRALQAVANALHRLASRQFQHQHQRSQPAQRPTHPAHGLLPAGAACADALPMSAALLLMNWPIRFSNTTALWVCRITSPLARFFSSAPGSRPMYCSPSRPEVRILAELSFGNCVAFCRLITTLAWKVLSSKLIDSTRPTTTPALLTAAFGFRPPMLSKRADTW